jgi:hypothetical protein
MTVRIIQGDVREVLPTLVFHSQRLPQNEGRCTRGIIA